MSCSRCVDMRCRHEYRTMFFHRLIDCLVPMYHMIASERRLWHRDGGATRGNLCIISEAGVLHPFLESLLQERGIVHIQRDLSAQLLPKMRCRMPPRNGWSNISEIREGSFQLRRDVATSEHLSLSNTSSISKLVLIDRQASRRFMNTSGLRDFLQARPPSTHCCSSRLSQFDSNPS